MPTLKNTTINDTGYLQLPKGTTAQRPGSPNNGDIRYNTDLNTVEHCVGGEWKYMPAVIEDGLVLHLDAAEPASYPGTGTTWFDLSGNGNNCTWSSTPTYGTDASYGNTKYFTTLSNSCTGPASNSFGITNTSGYTICHVFRQISLVNTAGFQFMSSNGTGVDSRGIFAHSTWGDEVYYFDQGGCCAADQRVQINQSGITTTNYNMYCVRSTVATREIYRNGQKLIQTTTAAADINLSSSPVYVSGGPDHGGSSSTWDARLSLFLVYNRPLSDVEIQQNFNALRGRYGI